MTGMTPEDAGSFYEDDEDPSELFAWFDAGPDGVTAVSAAVQQPADVAMVARVVDTGLYGRLRRELLPEVSASGSNTRYAQQA